MWVSWSLLLICLTIFSGAILDPISGQGIQDGLDPIEANQPGFTPSDPDPR